MKLRAAIVGCGMISEFHLRGWQRIPEVEIVALADPDLDRARERARTVKPDATMYPDLKSLLAATELDFIDILTPPRLHYEHCLRAAERNVHIICQKPLCDRIEDAEALVTELADYPRLFCVHENHPWRPWFLDVRKLHREGFFGEGVRLSLQQHDSKEPPEKFKTEAEHGIMLDYGVHLVAMARALFGDLAPVEASFDRINPRVRGESRARVRFGFGAAPVVADIDIAWQDHQPFRGGFSLKGDEGEALLEGTMARGERSRFTIRRGHEIVRDEWRCPTDDYAESFYLFQRQFTDAVSGKTPAPQPAAENLSMLRAVFAAYRMAHVHKPQTKS